MFKDFVSTDLATFFSAQEFCATLTVNGTPMQVLLDSGTGTVSRGYRETLDGRNGTFTDRLTLYVKASQYGVRPVVDALIDVDGEEYVVIGCKDVDGVYEVDIEAVMS